MPTIEINKNGDLHISFNCDEDRENFIKNVNLVGENKRISDLLEIMKNLEEKEREEILKSLVKDYKEKNSIESLWVCVYLNRELTK